MDFSKLPENPKTPEERSVTIERLGKNFLKEVELAHRSIVEAQVLSLNETLVRKHTFALAHVLHAHLSTSNATAHNETDNWVWLRYFLEKCDENEIRWCDEQLENLCRVLAETSSNKGLRLSMLAVGPLFIALRKRTGGCWNELTSIHTNLLQVCLVSKMYSIAAQVADAGGISICPRRNGGAPPKSLALDLQRYFYYAGIAYCGMKRFKDSLHAFSECLTLPAKSFGAVHAEAYRKFVLVSLIGCGKLIVLPRYTPNAVIKAVNATERSLFSNYQRLAVAFEKTDQGEELKQVIQDQVCAAEFKNNGNWGLVSEVFDAYWRNRIVKLTGTYVTLAISDIGKAIGSQHDKTELQLLKMIQSREIRAKLDQRSGTVRFLSVSEDQEEQANTVSKIETEIARVTAFASDLRALDTKLSTSKIYISRLTLRRGAPLATARESTDAL